MKKYLLWLCILFCGGKALAHPMPSSVVTLSILENAVSGETKIPLRELGNAVGDERINNMADPFFTAYFTKHIKATSRAGEWTTQIGNIKVVTGNDPVIGVYKEVIVRFSLTPSDIRYLRNFTFNYDAVMHQVVTHSALVYVQQDWKNGIQDGNNALQIGVIGMDVPTEKIYPLQINLEQGSWWKGFKSMLNSGMQHIKEGTDHLLFLIVLLLPAMLLTNGKQWGRFGGIRYSVSRLIKIVTAFTIGHSVTLLAGAFCGLKLPGQPVEILIAFSILVSAVHAMRPIFAGKEIYIAAGFGLVHGLAFTTVLSNLRLSAIPMALSILGFNLGIEIMQLFIIVLIVPWLILLSKTPGYKWIRTIFAASAGIAALAWIAERSTGKANFITGFVELAAQYGIWCIEALALSSLVVYAVTLYYNRNAKLVS